MRTKARVSCRAELRSIGFESSGALDTLWRTKQWEGSMAIAQSPRSERSAGMIVVATSDGNRQGRGLEVPSFQVVCEHAEPSYNLESVVVIAGRDWKPNINAQSGNP